MESFTNEQFFFRFPDETLAEENTTIINNAANTVKQNCRDVFFSGIIFFMQKNWWQAYILLCQFVRTS